MMGRLKRMLASLRRWMQANARDHAAARPHGCCSQPPPGAGRKT